MICISRIYEAHENYEKTNLQQQYRKKSILSVGCTSELFGKNAKWRKAIAFHQTLQMPVYIIINGFGASGKTEVQTASSLTAEYFKTLISIQSHVEAN